MHEYLFTVIGDGAVAIRSGLYAVRKSIAEAILPLLAYTASRRLGLLCYLRGEDIRLKHSVYAAQTEGIVCDKGVWKRVPIKTPGSLSFFVLHNKLVGVRRRQLR